MTTTTRLYPHGLWAAALSLFATSCLTAAPPASLRTEASLVRANSQAEAELISDLVERLRPRLLSLVPDSRLDPDVEVWVQDEPSLYAFPSHAHSDAEGLWSADHGRILLARDAEDIERTLAHEMTHAALGSSWKALPGSMEEGLCDLVSGHLCPRGATRLRAGRLCSAALASGGLRMRLELRVDGDPNKVLWTSRLVLTAREKQEGGVMQVFQMQAGLSSTKLESGAKRGYYGLAYLVASRIVERHGMEGLQSLCATAQEKGYRLVPANWLLEAAELDRNDATWRRASAMSLSHREVTDLLRIYPDVIGGAVEDVRTSLGTALAGREDISMWAIPEEGQVEVELSLPSAMVQMASN
ncbi:MAG: hypothetical protein ACI841_001281 [Planctomycetota bacterium]